MQWEWESYEPFPGDLGHCAHCSRGYDVETYVIGLVNGQEKLTRE